VATGATFAPPHDAIARYWNEHIHDLAVATCDIGSVGFFDELDAYRFDKLRYLPNLVDFAGYRGQRLLEVGCGVGIDLVRFARGGADVVGIDLAATSIDLAEKNFAQRGLPGEFHVMNGEAMTFADASFDVVYAHGVLQYTADPAQMMREIHRVLKPGGEVISMVYNTRSWLKFMSIAMGVPLEHEDAPFIRTFTRGEFIELFKPFGNHGIVPERFPVPTKLHKGLKAILYNNVFVGAFNILPKCMTRWSGWHLMGFAEKREQPKK
jgi:ubiquinone/menaquinone biosynthesis C-methylase UbiE